MTTTLQPSVPTRAARCSGWSPTRNDDTYIRTTGLHLAQPIVKQLPLTPLPMRVLRILALVLAVLPLGLSNWPSWNLAAGLAPGPVSAGTHLGGAALVAVGVAVGTRPVSEPAGYPGSFARSHAAPRSPVMLADGRLPR
jgi:hypothetical protein